MFRKRIVDIYVDSNGRRPYVKWLKKLKDKRFITRITYRIKRLETDGYIGLVEPVGEGVFEVKFYFGGGIRVYFGEENNNLIILLLGGDKSTQRKDLEKAKKYWNDYQERNDDERQANREFSRTSH